MTPERKDEVRRMANAYGFKPNSTVERLLSYAIHESLDALDSRDSQISALLADNARLRAALVELLDAPLNPEATETIARRALGAKVAQGVHRRKG